jgi:hypothetical protein
MVFVAAKDVENVGSTLAHRWLIFFKNVTNVERPVGTLFGWLKIKRTFFWLPASCVTGIVGTSIPALVQI